MPRTLPFYSALPISDCEARAILLLDRDQYDFFQISKVLLQSIDLSLERPGFFKAHSFWDIVRCRLFLDLRRIIISDEADLLSRLDATLDEVALSIDADFDVFGDVRRREVLLAELFREHFPEVLTNRRERALVRRISLNWRVLERRLEKFLAIRAALMM